MNIEQIAKKLEEGGCTVKIWKDKRVYVTSTPNGGKAEFGYLVAGDDGGTGSCQGVTKRAGEIAAILRA